MNDPEMNDVFDEDFIMRRRALEFNFLVGNKVKDIGDVVNLVLGGLSGEQRSYLSFLDHYNVVEIESIEVVPIRLAGLSESRDTILSFRSNDVLAALCLANKLNALLQLDDHADIIEFSSVEDASGIVIIEKIPAVSVVIALNYALSVKAQVVLVQTSETYDHNDITNLIFRWRSAQQMAYDELLAEVNDRVGTISFNSYSCASFFTTGLPYSLLLENEIPMSHIHLHARPDFLIVNSLIVSDRNSSSAVIFSPRFFADEEVEFISDVLTDRNYYVRELFGNSATVYNLEMNLTEFPFDIFHICSHGGTASGASVTEIFIDRDGIRHEVVYDSVLGLMRVPNEEKLKVTVLMYRRFLDGVYWGSDEFRALGYDHSFYIDLQVSLNSNNKDNRLNVTPKSSVPGSESIKASDSNYFPTFDFLGSLESPFIFNNSCWSGRNIVDHFLNAGAKGYVGTLWDVEEDVATYTAKLFYREVDRLTISEALQDCHQELRGTRSDNIYIYWGLHSTRILPSESSTQAKRIVAEKLLNSHYEYSDKLEQQLPENAKFDLRTKSNWCNDQLFETFELEVREIILNNWRSALLGD
ncbi:hypothetical protein ACFP1I_23270 [Dyadobacter subterraneus]|uniref:CHAT domain-containing protein n=1 Tax=Dyadobacter subterraneus TaxID=2773304 RepID=A0ABR9W900_9BACT|nr:hypothetical protein [Dyadobacter subterraneus]MBE9461912.1 hypothetical protein [Dyadobacter subterraneus]